MDGGADVNQFDYNGATALHLATLYGHAGLVDMLLAKNAQPNAVDRSGRSNCVALYLVM